MSQTVCTVSNPLSSGAWTASPIRGGLYLAGPPRYPQHLHGAWARVSIPSEHVSGCITGWSGLLLNYYLYPSLEETA